jgi:hypothetical protein
MVAEPQQAAVTNAVLLGALREEKKEKLKHANNRNSVSLFTKGHLFRCVKFILEEDTRWTGRTMFDRHPRGRTGHLLEYVQRRSFFIARPFVCAPRIPRN